LKREQFEHTVRAAGAILGTDEVLVIGSQAIHASIDFELPEATRSIETDIAALEDPDGAKADLIDGSIGELSMFQASYGYYAQGVTPQTAVLPTGWRDRLIPYETPATKGVKALCLEPHDLWISKAIAGRPKDHEYCESMARHGIVHIETLKQRINDVEADGRIRARVLSLLSAIEQCDRSETSFRKSP
jgi:hypothetical protein